MANGIAVLSIILVLFLFIDEKKLKTKEQIIEDVKERNIKRYNKTLKYIKEDISIIEYNSSNSINDIVANIKTNYVVIKNTEYNIENIHIEQIIANYSLYEGYICFVEGRYFIKENYKGMRKLKQKLFMDFLNYINIFDKNRLENYALVISKRDNIQRYFNKKYNKKIIFQSEEIYTDLKDIKNIIKKCKEGIKNINIKTLLKTSLFIISTWSILLNIIRNIKNIDKNIYSFVIAVLIYYCYTVVVRYMYRKIGRMRYIASYLFSISIVIYFGVYIYLFIYKGKKT